MRPPFKRPQSYRLSKGQDKRPRRRVRFAFAFGQVRLGFVRQRPPPWRPCPPFGAAVGAPLPCGGSSGAHLKGGPEHDFSQSKQKRTARHLQAGRIPLCPVRQPAGAANPPHIVFRSHGGSNDPANLITLCWRVPPRKPMGRPFQSGIPTSAPVGKTVRALQKSTSRPAQSTSVTTTPTWASSLTLSTVGGFNAPL